jgi:hypothetical protein
MNEENLIKQIEQFGRTFKENAIKMLDMFDMLLTLSEQIEPEKRNDTIRILDGEHKIFRVGNQWWSDDLFIPAIGRKVSADNTAFTWYHLPAIQALLPEGWRIPTKEDCEKLKDNADYENWSCHVDMKDEFWSSTEINTYSAYFSSYKEGDLYPYNITDKRFRFRVRCVRDITVDKELLNTVLKDIDNFYKIKPL